jgi:hypothetical protein
MKTINEFKNSQIENIDKEISNLETRKRFIIEKTKQLEEHFPKIQEIISKQGLEIQNFNVSFNTESAKLSLSLIPNEKCKIKFLTFRGYNSRGGSKNSKSKEQKAQKFDDMLNVTDIRFSSNKSSFEDEEGKSHRILVNGWL